MSLTITYTNESSEVKSQNSQGNISLILGYNGRPYDLHVINDNNLRIRIGNQEGYIDDINIDTNTLDDDEKYRGAFSIPLSNNVIQKLPPGVYYLEVWINVNDQNNQTQQMIFPSDDTLPFTLTPNIVNDSNSLPMITFDRVRQAWEDFKNFIMGHQAQIEDDLATFDGVTDSFVDEIDANTSGYGEFVKSADSNLVSLASSGAIYINNAITSTSNKITNIDNKVNSANTSIDSAANDVYSTVDSDVASAKDSIANVVSSADTDTVGTTSSATSTIHSEANSVVGNVTSTMNSADYRINHAADNISGEVTSLVTSGNNIIHNTERNIENVTDSAVTNANNQTNTINAITSSAVANVNYTVNSADNYVSNLTSDTDNKLISADSHVDSTVISANSHMSNFASNINDRTSSADSHVDSHISSADNHINSTVISADDNMSNFASNINNRTSSANSHVDSHISSADDHVDSTVISAESHMSNFAGNINDRTSSADSHVDSHISSADNHIDSLFNSTSGKTVSAASFIDSKTIKLNNKASSAYYSIAQSASSANTSVSSNITSKTISGIDTLNGVVSGAGVHLRKSVTSDVTNNINHSMDDLRSDVASDNSNVATNNSNVENYAHDVNTTRKDIATVYNQLFTSNAMNRQDLDKISKSLSSQINDDETKSEANSAHTSLVNQVVSLSAANSNLGNVLGSNTGSKLSSLAKQFSDFDNITQSGLATRIGSNAASINDLNNTVNNNVNSVNAQLGDNYNNLRAYDDSLQRQINNNNSTLQNQINDNYNKDLAPKGLLTGGDMNSFTTTGMYNMVGTFDNAPIPNNHHFWAYLTVLNYQTTNPNNGNSASPSQFLVINVDDTDPDNYNSTAYYRSGAGYSVNGSWVKVSTSKDIQGLQDQINNRPSWDDENWTRQQSTNRDNDLQNQITNNYNNGLVNKGSLPGGADCDLNNVTTPGIYQTFNFMEMKNAPSSDQSIYDWGTLVVYNSNGWCAQIYYGCSNDANGANRVEIIERGRDSVWHSWKKIADQDGINNLQNQINSLPNWNDENWTRNQANQAATNALNQANANMEVNRSNLQNQITNNFNNALVYKGIAGMWNWNEMTSTGIYSLDGGQSPWNTPYNDSQPKYGTLIVIPNANPAWNQKVQIFFDNNGVSGSNPTMSWRFLGGSVTNDWHIVANGQDLIKIQEQIGRLPNRDDVEEVKNITDQQGAMIQNVKNPVDYMTHEIDELKSEHEADQSHINELNNNVSEIKEKFNNMIDTVSHYMSAKGDVDYSSTDLEYGDKIS